MDLARLALILVGIVLLVLGAVNLAHHVVTLGLIELAVGVVMLVLAGARNGRLRV